MTLDEQYQKVIDDQREHLLALQNVFNKECEDAKTSAQDKLKNIPEENKEEKEEVLKKQKEELNNSLSKLKAGVDESTRSTMKALENIIRQKELLILEDLEKQLANL